MSLSMRERGWTRWTLKVFFNPYHSIIPQKQSHECLGNILNTTRQGPAPQCWGEAVQHTVLQGGTWTQVSTSDHQTTTHKPHWPLSKPPYASPGFFGKHFKVLLIKKSNIKVTCYLQYLHLLKSTDFLTTRGRPYICSTLKCLHKTRLYEICTLLTLVKPPH